MSAYKGSQDTTEVQGDADAVATLGRNDLKACMRTVLALQILYQCTMYDSARAALTGIISTGMNLGPSQFCRSCVQHAVGNVAGGGPPCYLPGSQVRQRDGTPAPLSCWAFAHRDAAPQSLASSHFSNPGRSKAPRLRHACTDPRPAGTDTLPLDRHLLLTGAIGVLTNYSLHKSALVRRDGTDHATGIQRLPAAPRPQPGDVQQRPLPAAPHHHSPLTCCRYAS